MGWKAFTVKQVIWGEGRNKIENKKQENLVGGEKKRAQERR